MRQGLLNGVTGAELLGLKRTTLLEKLKRFQKPEQTEAT